MRGLFPGRFQPFHRGHRRAVERIAGENEAVIVAVGSAQASHTIRNPFTAGERVRMVHRALADLATTTTYVVPVEDVGQHALWWARLRTVCPPFGAIYTNNRVLEQVARDGNGDTEVRGVELVDRDRLRGTEIRRRIREDDGWRDRVPAPVGTVIEEIGGVDRLRRVADRPS